MFFLLEKQFKRTGNSPYNKNRYNRNYAQNCHHPLFKSKLPTTHTNSSSLLELRGSLHKMNNLQLKQNNSLRVIPELAVKALALHVTSSEPWSTIPFICLIPLVASFEYIVQARQNRMLNDPPHKKSHYSKPPAWQTRYIHYQTGQETRHFALTETSSHQKQLFTRVNPPVHWYLWSSSASN